MNVVPNLKVHPQDGIAILERIDDFAPFMDQAQSLVQNAQGQGDVEATYDRISELVGQRLMRWFSEGVREEEKKEKNRILQSFGGVYDAFAYGSLRNVGWEIGILLPEWRSQIEREHEGDRLQHLLECLGVIERFAQNNDLNRQCPRLSRLPEEVRNALETLRQELEIEFRHYKELNEADLDAAIHGYETGSRILGAFAVRVLEVQKLFKSMCPGGFRAANLAAEADALSPIARRVPILSEIIAEKLPKHYIPVRMNDWVLPGGKRVSNLAQIWANPSLRKLVQMIKKTAALFMRYLKGTYRLWKKQPFDSSWINRGDREELIELFAKGYKLQWYRNRTSPQEFVGWLQECVGQQMQFPRLEAALSGILFPKRGENFNPDSFRLFLHERNLYPTIEDLQGERRYVRKQIKDINQEMICLCQIFEDSRNFRGSISLFSFKSSLGRLVQRCVWFEEMIHKPFERTAILPKGTLYSHLRAHGWGIYP